MSELDAVLEDVCRYLVKAPLFKEYMCLDEKGVCKLVATLQVTRCVSHLSLCFVRLEENVFRALCQFLKSSPDCVVKKADFSHCKLKVAHAHHLADSLSQNKSLQSLNLSCNALYEEGVMILAKKGFNGLKKLSLAKNNCKIVAAAELVICAERLVSLDLSENEISGENPVWKEGLKKNTSLKKLNLSDNPLYPHGFRCVGEAMKENQTLQKLNLCCVKSGEGSGVWMCQNVLNLNNSLISLNLAFNSLTKEDAVAFGVYLSQKNAFLKEIVLNSNPLQYGGYCALSEAMKYNTSLLRLSLAGISGKCVLPLPFFLTDFNLEGNTLGPDGGSRLGKSLKNSQNLRRLSLRRIWPSWTDFLGICRGLKKNSSLRTLDLSSNKLDAKYAHLIRQCFGQRKNVALSHLCLNWNVLGVEGAKEISQLLCENQSLTRIDLCQNQISIQGAQCLFESFFLKKNSSLTQLDVSQNELSGREWALCLARLIEQNKTLRHICAKKNRFGEEGTKILAEALKKNHNQSNLSYFLIDWDSVHDNLMREVVENNPNVDIGNYLSKKNAYKRRFGVEMSVVTFLSIRKYRHCHMLNQHPKEIISMIAKALLLTSREMWEL